MDERRGVRCARSRGLVVIRTPLIYADAKILGLIGSVQEKLDELRSRGSGFRPVTMSRSSRISASYSRISRFRSFDESAVVEQKRSITFASMKH